MLRPRRLSLALTLSLLAASAPLAAQDWDLCRVPVLTFVENADLADGETRVEAQTVASEDRDSLRLRGDVSLVRRQHRIRADELVIDKASERVEASGNVLFEDASQRLSSQAIAIDSRAQTGRIENAEFELMDNHGRGSAAEIEQIDPWRSRYRDLEYTTCDPDDRDWHLRAAEMQLDDESGRGSARHARLYFGGLPFLYLPWFQFPVDDRRLSGLLTPSLGYSDDNGNSLSLPVYWNMAPNYDMTLTPAWFSDRGTQLNTENRYLVGTHQGQLDLSYLDDDKTGDSRWFQQWRHRAALAAGVDADLLLVEVSDGEIFDDFDNMASEYNNSSHLERRLRLQRNGAVWEGELLWQDYQTLDRATAVADRPYNRLPRLSLAADPEAWPGGIETPLALELVEFDRDDSVTGQRSHLLASANWSASRSWYFFEPSLQLALTDYRLENNAGDDHLSRGLPTLSIDTGLIFERRAGARDRWVHTLEPRLFFLYTPFEDQDEIPDFDTSLNASTYLNLFSNNRFTGADRIGDARQVTLGLASRVYDAGSGSQLMHFRIGQIFYFADRRVSLDGRREDAGKSDVISELDLWPNPRTRIATRLVYEQAENEINDRDLSINYADDGFAANLGYYYQRDELEQVRVSAVYPVNERWTIIAKAHRSLRFEKPVENLLGLGYQSCCWGLKILAARTGDEDDAFAETDNSIYLELTLKGLSSAGRDIDSQLGDAIPGYRPLF